MADKIYPHMGIQMSNIYTERVELFFNVYILLLLSFNQQSIQTNAKYCGQGGHRHSPYNIFHNKYLLINDYKMQWSN